MNPKVNIFPFIPPISLISIRVYFIIPVIESFSTEYFTFDFNNNLCSARRSLSISTIDRLVISTLSIPQKQETLWKMLLISFSFFAWPDRICSFDLRAIVRMMRCVEMNHSFPEPPCAFPHGDTHGKDD